MVNSQARCTAVEPNWSTYNTTPTPKAQGSLQKRGTAGLFEPQGQGVWCETRSPRKFRSCHHKVSPAWLPKQELNRDNTNLCARVGGAKTINPQPYTRNCRQLRDARKGRVFFIEECANWLSHIKRSALKTYVQIPFYRLLPTRKWSFPDHGWEQSQSIRGYKCKYLESCLQHVQSAKKDSSFHPRPYDFSDIGILTYFTAPGMNSFLWSRSQI